MVKKTLKLESRWGQLLPAATRTDPYVKDYLIRLLPLVGRESVGWDIQYHLPTGDCDGQGIEYLVAAATRPEPITETDEVLLVNTLRVSEEKVSPESLMPAFPSEPFADRPGGEHHRCSLPQGTKETSRFSRLECPRMHRFSYFAVFVAASPWAARTMLPSLCQDRIGTQE